MAEWPSTVMWHERSLLVFRSLEVKCPGRKESFEINQIYKTVLKKYCSNLNIKPRSSHRNSCDTHVMLPNRLQQYLQLVWHLECGTSIFRSRTNFALWRQTALDSPGWGCSTEAGTWGCTHPYGELTCRRVGWELVCLDLASEFPGKQVVILVSLDPQD